MGSLRFRLSTPMALIEKSERPAVRTLHERRRASREALRDIMSDTVARRKKTAKVRGVFERVPGSGDRFIRYTDQFGAPHREHVGPKGLAKTVLALRKAEIAEARFLPNARVLLKAAIEAYMVDARQRVRRTNDIERYAKFWGAVLGHRMIRSITRADIDTVRNRRRSAGASVATTNRELAFLRSVFFYAKGAKWVLDIPFGRESEKVKFGAEGKGRIRYLLDDEEKRLRETMEAEQWAKVQFALLTGFRQGNQFRLPWTDVNFDAGTITASKSKSGENYTIPMSDEV